MKQYHLTMLLVVLMNVLETKAFAQIIKAKDAKGKPLYYQIISSNELEVVNIDYNRGSVKGDLVIPESVTHGGKSYNVTSIASYAFCENKKITSMTIPNSVKSIGRAAFQDCSSLTTVAISGNVTNIDEYTFQGCSSLTSITIPNGVKTIGVYAFYGCRRLASVVIPASVTSIGGGAFWDCGNLMELTIPDGVKSIGGAAFNGCSLLSTVTIPNSVTSIGNNAFDGCTRLAEVTISDGTRALEVDYSAFGYKNNSIKKLYLGRNIRVPKNTSTSSPFSDNKSLEKVVIGNNVTTIGDNAFDECINLTECTIPNSVTSIGKSAFYNCSNLTEWIVPNSVTSIGDHAFYGCKGLTSVTIPYGVTSIGKFTFCDCVNLTSVSIPATVKFIGEMAFFGCESLTSVAVPKDCNITSGNYLRDIQITRYEPDDYPLLADNQPAVENRPQQPVVLQPVRPQPVFNGKSDVDLNIPTSSTSNENTFAVIIGNENYMKVSKVDYALNDVTIFAEYCQKTLGLPAKNIRGYQDATFAMMLSAVKDIQDIADAYNGDLNVIFYYAGHGIPDESTSDAFLLPIDADGRQAEVCYPLNRLYRQLGSMGAKSVTVFMDACFSGSERGSQMLASARGVAIKAKASVPSGNMVVFSAASGDETAYPYREKGHGLFTYFLLKKLQETRGGATLEELGSYIIDRVKKESVVSNGKSQTPTVTPSPAFGNEWQQMKLK